MTHALGGPDAGSLTIDPGAGRLKTEAARDFEGRETYTVEVTATDSSNAGATAEVTIKVTDGTKPRRSWPGDHGPEIMAGGLAKSGSSGVPCDENGTAAGPGAAEAAWTLEGEDAGDFSINGGMLTFSSSPDYEMPTDANTDNIYTVTVKLR